MMYSPTQGSYFNPGQQFPGMQGMQMQGMPSNPMQGRPNFSSFNPGRLGGGLQSSAGNGMQNLGSTALGGVSSIGSGITGGIGNIMDWMSGSGLADQGFDKAEGQGQQYFDQGNQYLSPYQQAGGGAYGQYNNWAQRMQDPTAFINHIMSQYQQSPQALFEEQQGMRAMNQSAAAGGNAGTPAEMRALGRYDQGVNSQDIQKYMDHALDVNQQYGGALNNMNQMDFNASMGMNQNRMGLANLLAQLSSNRGMTDMYGRQQGMSDIMQVGGMIAGL